MSAGRLSKRLGDVLLLRGEVERATVFLESAVKLARTHNDNLWLAAALETSASAVLLLDGMPFSAALTRLK